MFNAQLEMCFMGRPKSIMVAQRRGDGEDGLIRLRSVDSLADYREVRINEVYSGYRPPVNVTKVVRGLLAAVPDQYVRGLDCVVLTNLSGQPRRKRIGKTISRGRRIPNRRVAGLYHGKWKGQRPWIELYVDQILRRWPRWTLWIPFARDLAIADTFYHELGHHVHLFIRPEYREKEDVADDWGRKFMLMFLQREYRYLKPLAKVVRLIRGRRTDKSDAH
jgi:hypothetical protein